MPRAGSNEVELKDTTLVPTRSGFLEINEEWCKGCRLCVEACKHDVIKIGEIGKVQVDKPEKCSMCGQCEAVCPDFAIRVNRKDA
mgnify:CR=1 FL=1